MIAYEHRTFTNQGLQNHVAEILMMTWQDEQVSGRVYRPQLASGDSGVKGYSICNAEVMCLSCKTGAGAIVIIANECHVPVLRAQTSERLHRKLKALFPMQTAYAKKKKTISGYPRLRAPLPGRVCISEPGVEVDSIGNNAPFLTFT